MILKPPHISDVTTALEKEAEDADPFAMKNQKAQAQARSQVYKAMKEEENKGEADREEVDLEADPKSADKAEEKPPEPEAMPPQVSLVVLLTGTAGIFAGSLYLLKTSWSVSVP